MLPLVRLYVRTALLWLVIAMALGLAQAFAGWRGGPGWLIAMRATVWHMLAVGWLNQLIWGVAHWMFPAASREQPRGWLAPAAAAYALLNVGLLLRVVAEPMLLEGGGGWGAVLAVGGVLQWLAALGFVLHIWPRVRGPLRRRA